MLTSGKAVEMQVQLFAYALDILRKKRVDYSGYDDPFRNLRLAEHLGIHPVKGVMIRLSDKVSRVCSLIDQHSDSGLVEEKLEDTLADILNYVGIAVGLLCEEYPELMERLDNYDIHDALRKVGYV